MLFRNAVKVMFVQGWGNVHRNYSSRKWYDIVSWRKADRAGLIPRDMSCSYRDLGYDFVMTVSEYVTEYLSSRMGIEAVTITNRLDRRLFVAQPTRRIPNTILALKRKNLNDIREVQRTVARLLPYPKPKWILVDGLSQAELVQKYQEADIFFASGYPEGFGRPPLEAMSCGAAVVGFTGGGASGFMRHGETALVATDGDCQTAAAHIVQLLQDASMKEQIRAEGTAEASRYDLSGLRDDLRVFYDSVRQWLRQS
jgi:hypothetical protein